MAYINRYGYHQKIISFMGTKFYLNQVNHLENCVFQPALIALELKKSEDWTEEVMFELKEDGSLTYDYTRGFIINDLGLLRKMTKFYEKKQRVYFRELVKDSLLFIISALTIVAFFYTHFNTDIDKLKMKVESLERKVIEQEKFNRVNR